MSSLNNRAVAFCRLLPNVAGTSAPEFVHALAKAAAAVEAWFSTPVSCVVFVTRARRPSRSLARMSAVAPVTLDAYFVSATILPMCALGM